MHQGSHNRMTGFLMVVLLWHNVNLLFIFHNNLNTTIYQVTLEVNTAGRHRGMMLD